MQITTSSLLIGMGIGGAAVTGAALAVRFILNVARERRRRHEERLTAELLLKAFVEELPETQARDDFDSIARPMAGPPTFLQTQAAFGMRGMNEYLQMQAAFGMRGMNKQAMFENKQAMFENKQAMFDLNGIQVSKGTQSLSMPALMGLPKIWIPDKGKKEVYVLSPDDFDRMRSDFQLHRRTFKNETIEIEEKDDIVTFCLMGTVYHVASDIFRTVKGFCDSPYWQRILR